MIGNKNIFTKDVFYIWEPIQLNMATPTRMEVVHER